MHLEKAYNLLKTSFQFLLKILWKIWKIIFLLGVKIAEIGVKLNPFLIFDTIKYDQFVKNIGNGEAEPLFQRKFIYYIFYKIFTRNGKPFFHKM